MYSVCLPFIVFATCACSIQGLYVLFCILFKEIVKGNDLSSLSAKKVRRALEERFNVDFTNRFVKFLIKKKGGGGNV